MLPLIMSTSLHIPMKAATSIEQKGGLAIDFPSMFQYAFDQQQQQQQQVL